MSQIDKLLRKFQTSKKELTDFRKKQTIKNDELRERLTKLEPKDHQERRKRDESHHRNLRKEENDCDTDESCPRNHRETEI